MMKVSKLAKLDTTDASAKEAKRYLKALLHGYSSIKKTDIINHQLIIQLCNILKNTTNEFRKNPNVTVKNHTTDEIIYSPPSSGDILKSKIDNWVQFANDPESELDPLVKMAVAHYQFEAIHPFEDGNGRTGRMLNILMLITNKTLDLPVLYLSRYVLENKNTYYRLIQEVTEKGSWLEWIEFMVRGIDETAKWTTQKINAISSLINHTKQHIKAHEAKAGELKIYSHELINLIFKRMYCTSQDFEDQNIVKRRTAKKYLQKLVDIGVLEQYQDGNNKEYAHIRFYELLISNTNQYSAYTPIPNPKTSQSNK